MRKRFAVWVDDRRYPASLEDRRVYAVVTDRKAERLGFQRVIDEPGEDYRYARARFVPVWLSTAARRGFAP